MKAEFHFDVRLAQDDHVTVATLEAEGFEDIIGSAKRHPTDEHQPEVGITLALNRMFANLATHYQIAFQDLTEAAQLEEELAAVDPEAGFWAQFEIPTKETE